MNTILLLCLLQTGYPPLTDPCNNGYDLNDDAQLTEAVQLELNAWVQQEFGASSLETVPNPWGQWKPDYFWTADPDNYISVGQHLIAYSDIIGAGWYTQANWPAVGAAYWNLTHPDSPPLLPSDLASCIQVYEDAGKAYEDDVMNEYMVTTFENNRQLWIDITLDTAVQAAMYRRPDCQAVIAEAARICRFHVLSWKDSVGRQGYDFGSGEYTVSYEGELFSSPSTYWSRTAMSSYNLVLLATFDLCLPD